MSSTGTMKGHGYVLLPSRLVGAVLGDSDVSTVLRGRQATAPSTPSLEGLHTSSEWVAPWMGGWFRSTPFRSPLQGGLKGLGARGGGVDEGLKVEGGFTFGRLQGGFKGA